jgi:hypothetical protein
MGPSSENVRRKSPTSRRSGAARVTRDTQDVICEFTPEGPDLGHHCATSKIPKDVLASRPAQQGCQGVLARSNRICPMPVDLSALAYWRRCDRDLIGEGRTMRPLAMNRATKRPIHATLRAAFPALAGEARVPVETHGIVLKVHRTDIPWHLHREYEPFRPGYRSGFPPGCGALSCSP